MFPLDQGHARKRHLGILSRSRCASSCFSERPWEASQQIYGIQHDWPCHWGFRWLSSSWLARGWLPWPVPRGAQVAVATFPNSGVLRRPTGWETSLVACTCPRILLVGILTFPTVRFCRQMLTLPNPSFSSPYVLAMTTLLARSSPGFSYNTLLFWCVQLPWLLPSHPRYQMAQGQSPGWPQWAHLPKSGQMVGCQLAFALTFLPFLYWGMHSSKLGPPGPDYLALCAVQYSLWPWSQL